MRGYFTRSGSILERTESHRSAGLEVSLDIESPAGADTIAELVWLAEDMCFVMQALKNPVETKLEITLNGQSVSPLEG